MIPTKLIEHDTAATPLTYKDSAGKALNITSYQFAIKIAYSTPLVKQAVITDAPNGKLEFRWGSTDLVAGTYAYEIMVTDAGGKERTFKLGTLQILARIA